MLSVPSLHSTSFAEQISFSSTFAFSLPTYSSCFVLLEDVALDDDLRARVSTFFPISAPLAHATHALSPCLSVGVFLQALDSLPGRRETPLPSGACGTEHVSESFARCTVALRRKAFDLSRFTLAASLSALASIDSRVDHVPLSPSSVLSLL